MVAALPIFSPPDPSRILADLANPALSFNQVCERHNTCITALSLWLASPQITELSVAVDSALIQRARRSAVSLFPQAIVSLNHILAAHAKFEARTVTDPDEPQHIDRRQRARETARKAVTLLLRIARFQIIPMMQQVTQPSPHPRLNNSPNPTPSAIDVPPVRSQSPTATAIPPVRLQSPNATPAQPVRPATPIGTPGPAVQAISPVPSPSLTPTAPVRFPAIPPLPPHQLLKPPTRAAALVAAATHPP